MGEATDPSEAQQRADTKGAWCEIEVPRAPEWVWGFEPTTLPVRLYNRGLEELGPGGGGTLVGTADLHRADGTFWRRLAVRDLPRAVPSGDGAELDVELDVQAFAGEYELRLGLARREPGGALVPLPVRARPVPLRVRNTIFEAFVELVNSCNFKCSFCPQTTLQRPQRPMDFELAEKVVADLAAMGHHHPIRVHLLGEPLLYPRFFDFVEMAHGHGQRVLLATNGSRFEERNLAGILRTRLDEMVISLNTPEEELYLAQRGTAVPYREYLAGIERMVAEIVRRGPPPTTRINVLYDFTRADDPQELARVRRIAGEWIDLVRRVSGRDLPEPEEAVHLEVGATTLMLLAEGLELQWTSYHGWGEGKPPREHFCSYPWRQLAVLVDGQTTACCVDAEGEISLGDARTQSIETIWNGPALERLRQGFLRSRAVTPRCARCTMRHDKQEYFPDLALAPA